jgi:hypothetical protein
MIEGWGTCHIEITGELLQRIRFHRIWTPYIQVIKASHIGEKDFFQCLVRSPKLSPGYHGQMNFIIIDFHDVNSDFKFQKDIDT